jgi:hypothetical protein
MYSASRIHLSAESMRVHVQNSQSVVRGVDDQCIQLGRCYSVVLTSSGNGKYGIRFVNTEAVLYIYTCDELQ